MQGPSFLPSSLIQLSALVATENELFQMLEASPTDLFVYFESACGDESWLEAHPNFINLTLRWFAKMYYLSKIPLNLAQQVVHTIQKHYSLLQSFLTFQAALFFTATLYVEKQQYIVNSLLFGVSSPYFHDILKFECFERMRNEWELSYVTIFHFEIVLEHISRGVVDSLWKYSFSEIESLMQLAKKWQLPLLIKECATTMRRYLSRENVIDTLIQAHRDSYFDWKEECQSVFNLQGWGLRSLPGRESDLRIEMMDYNQSTLEIFKQLAPSITHLTFSNHLSEDPYYNLLIAQCPKLTGIDLTASLQYAQQLDVLPIHLTELNLSNCFWLKPEYIKEIGRLLPYLKHLDLRGNIHLNYHTWGQLARLTSLIHLDLSRCSQITDADLRLISQSCPNLIELNLFNCHSLTDTGIAEVIHFCSHLTMLDLS